MALEKTHTCVLHLRVTASAGLEPESRLRTEATRCHFSFSSENTPDVHLSVRMYKSRSRIIHNKQISSSHFATTEFAHPTSICFTLQTKKRGGWWTQGWTRRSHCKQHHYQVRESQFASHIKSADGKHIQRNERNSNVPTKLSVTSVCQKLSFDILICSDIVWWTLVLPVKSKY